ncbi:restriction endonuclease subunit S [Treponema sp. OMZ 791]|uniref:restriction endonuclease subunit S n=1 Tax=Treponema sp. OMZ 791 TaxID=2563666 RepID=UPI0020A55D8B|nr:restriction endonuclease subunit S [Treponema sp. OMZ 791]UTC72667.1 restriction endonuclease subunit S [Treponema sp. OMZ 791]
MRCDTYTLEELASIKYGKNQKKILSKNGDIPIYGTGGLMGYGAEALYDKPSVLIGRKGSIEKIRYVDHPFWTVDTLFYTEINTNLIIPRFLYYKILLLDLKKYNEGTTIPSLRTETLNKLQFDIPKLEAQKKILSILAPIDKKIRNLNKINDNLEQQAQAIFKKNFIECIEKDIVTLSDYCSFVKGKNPKLVADYFKKDYELYLNIDTLTNNKISYTTPDCLIKAGEKDILMVMDGASSGTVYFGKNGVVGSTIAKIVTLDDNMREIIYQALKYYENDIKNHTTGSAIPHTDKQYVLQLKISLPKNYHMFSTYFEKIRELIISNRNKNNILKSLRDTLLPKLMSGEIDVSNIKV